MSSSSRLPTIPSTATNIGMLSHTFSCLIAFAFAALPCLAAAEEKPPNIASDEPDRTAAMTQAVNDFKRTVVPGS